MRGAPPVVFTVTKAEKKTEKFSAAPAGYVPFAGTSTPVIVGGAACAKGVTANKTIAAQAAFQIDATMGGRDAKCLMRTNRAGRDPKNRTEDFIGQKCSGTGAQRVRKWSATSPRIPAPT